MGRSILDKNQKLSSSEKEILLDKWSAAQKYIANPPESPKSVAAEEGTYLLEPQPAVDSSQKNRLVFELKGLQSCNGGQLSTIFLNIPRTDEKPDIIDLSGNALFRKFAANELIGIFDDLPNNVKLNLDENQVEYMFDHDDHSDIRSLYKKLDDKNIELVTYESDQPVRDDNLYAKLSKVNQLPQPMQEPPKKDDGFCCIL